MRQLHLIRFIVTPCLSLALAASACTTVQQASEQIAVTKATIIGVYPPYQSAELPVEDVVQVEHLENAVIEAKRCLDTAEVDVRVLFASRLVLLLGDSAHEIKLPSDYPHSVVGILVAPGREPLIVRTNYGPNELQVTLPQAAGTYFELPRCREP